MKKNILKSAFLLAIIGGLSIACNIEPVPQPETDKTLASLELSASLPDVQTKTSLGSEPDYNVLWSVGDQISVNGVLSNAVAEEDHNKTSVRFRVEGNLAAPYKVLYPGSTETNVITLPATQNYVADSYDSAAYAAYGTVVELNGEYTTTLNNFCGLVRFALNGSATLNRIEVNALGGEKLYGEFTLADSFNGEFTGGAEGTLTYIFEEGLKLSATDTYVYIALPAQTYSAGVEAKVYQADGAFMRLKFWGEGFTLEGNHIRAFESKAYAAGRVEELRVARHLPEKVVDIRHVRHVAAALAGDVDLLAELFVLLQQNDLRSGVGGLQRGHHARRTAANDQHVTRGLCQHRPCIHPKFLPSDGNVR